jgi:hypothetical protein
MSIDWYAKDSNRDLQITKSPTWLTIWYAEQFLRIKYRCLSDFFFDFQIVAIRDLRQYKMVPQGSI